MSGGLIDIYVDVSGSMAGYKIEAVNRHLNFLLAEINASADTVHLYSFAKTTQRQRFSKNPKFSVCREPTSYDGLGEFVSTLVDAKKNGATMFMYTDGLVVENNAESEFAEKLKQKLQEAYSDRIGILVSPRRDQENLLYALSNRAVFGIDEDVDTIVAVLQRLDFTGCKTHQNDKPQTKQKGTKR